MTDLSPAAQALWDAFQRVECDEYYIDPRQAGLAAALEALADQVVPEQYYPPCSEGEPWPLAYQHMSDSRWEQRQQTRSEITAIAAELRREGGKS